ncbi:MAG TPA: exo-alpha-sialidase, partial [Planctomycetota bacterium]|nr:exo-alpha-sialidase [Planctomycetota bacterium]
LGNFELLQPHNIRELGGTVFLAEYQTFAQLSPIRLWASTDRGASWSVRYTFGGRRHAHALLADPARGALYCLLGDPTGGIMRSQDGGHSWSSFVEGFDGVVVDAVMTDRGLLYGTDGLYAPAYPRILATALDGTRQALLDLPGPSYSILEVGPQSALGQGGFLLGVTRETDGDVYDPDDLAAHVFSSPDGTRWRELLAFPRLSPDDYARADVRWQLRSGEVVLELFNVEGLGPEGRGFVLLDVFRQ